MDVRVITLRYQDAFQGFSEKAMRKAISGREVLEAREHFFMHGNVPHLLLTLLLGDVPAGGEVCRLIAKGREYRSIERVPRHLNQIAVKCIL